jgi:hypothetical protein
VIGRYIESDPIGILSRGPRGRLNHLFVYVENNPVLYQDSLGLCKWRGSLTLIGRGGEVLGGAVGIMSLQSDCCHCKKVSGTYSAFMGGFTIGIPYSTSTQFLTFEGPDTPDVSDPRGLFSIVSAGAGGSGVGYGMGQVTTGNLIAEIDAGMYLTPIDASMNLFIGYTSGSGQSTSCH